MAICHFLYEGVEECVRIQLLARKEKAVILILISTANRLNNDSTGYSISYTQGHVSKRENKLLVLM